MELDEGMIQWGLRAAMLRLPFLPTRAGSARQGLGAPDHAGAGR
jgi:acyl CoA:acetate/3-ketoacid CoA transferase alpha subunit